VLSFLTMILEMLTREIGVGTAVEALREGLVNKNQGGEGVKVGSWSGWNEK